MKEIERTTEPHNELHYQRMAQHEEELANLSTFSKNLLNQFRDFGSPLETQSAMEFNKGLLAAYLEAANFGFNLPFSMVVTYVAALADAFKHKLSEHLQSGHILQPVNLYTYALQADICELVLSSRRILTVLCELGPLSENITAGDFRSSSRDVYFEANQLGLSLPLSTSAIYIAALSEVLAKQATE